MFEVRGVTAGYGDTVVLRDVSVAVPDGSVVVLIGPNGAGKTTLLRVASGMIKPYAGQILIDGVDVTGEPTYKMSRNGVIHVPEGRGIFPSLTVADNILLQCPPGEFKKD
jgi:branched-chain amino acid transport system ATP-binding protein